LHVKPTSVSSPNVTQSRDLFKLLSPANPLTSVPNPSVTQLEDVLHNQLFAIPHQEEQSTNVTLLPELANVADLLVTITMHVPLILMSPERDVSTHKNANLTTCVSFQNATRLTEHVPMLIPTVMTEILVP